jgi:PAS domain S-box-containing protein
VKNSYDEGVADTPERGRSEHQLDNLRQQGGIFVEAVRLTRMPMIVTDATLPGNPIIFANGAFRELSGYELDEITGQTPQFMNGPLADAATLQAYEAAMTEGRVINKEVLQYRKDGEPFRAMLFASPIDDGQGTVLHHFLSYLDVTRQYDAEEALALLTEQLEAKVAARTAQLQHANAALERLVRDKEMLLAEVNHRAKNSLSIASALLGIQAGRQSDPKVGALFTDAQKRLMAMARVHDLLSQSETVQHVNFCSYLSNLCDALRPMRGPDGRVTLSVECEDAILLHADDAIPLGIIATELITNAIKYAFPAGVAGTIAVAAHRLPDSRIAFRVQDNGVGMSAPREGSLGYKLMETLVRQLRAEMRVQGQPGVTVTIMFDRPEG